MNWGRDIFTGVTMAVTALASFTASASMLSMAGMDFAACFTVSVLLALAGTLWLAWRGQTVVLAPSLTVTGYLVFIAAISHGLGWQAVLGISFWASIMGFILWQAGKKFFHQGLPQAFSWGIRLSLAVFLVCLGLKMGRIIINSPWQVTMLGDADDPLFYWSMAGLVLTLIMLADKRRGALFAGMAVTGTITFVEGFWIIPAAPFLAPEGLDKVAGMLSFGVPGQEMFFFWGTAVSLMVMLSAIHLGTWTTFAKDADLAAGVKSLLAFNALGALAGAMPLVISPASAAGQEAATAKRSGFVAAGVLAAALFCEPLIAAIADFPAMLVPVLVGGGLMLALAALQDCPFSSRDGLQRSEWLSMLVMVLLLPLTGDFAVALVAAFMVYLLGMSVRGK